MDRLDAWITRADDDCGYRLIPCRACYGRTRCEWTKSHIGKHLAIVWSEDIKNVVTYTWYGHFPKFKNWLKGIRNDR